MSDTTYICRGAGGAPLEEGPLAALRALIRRRGSARRLVDQLGGVSAAALERAAGGGRVHRGTRALIEAGLQRLREAGELDEAAP